MKRVLQTLVLVGTVGLVFGCTLNVYLGGEHVYSKDFLEKKAKAKGEKEAKGDAIKDSISNAIFGSGESENESE